MFFEGLPIAKFVASVRTVDTVKIAKTNGLKPIGRFIIVANGMRTAITTSPSPTCNPTVTWSRGSSTNKATSRAPTQKTAPRSARIENRDGEVTAAAAIRKTTKSETVVTVLAKKAIPFAS